MITEELQKEVQRLWESGVSRKKICQTLHIGNKKVQQILGPVETHRNTTGQIRSGWVINHPYEKNLREEERRRYHEVIHERQKHNPNMGWDYTAKQQVSYRNGVIYRPC